MHEIRIPIRWRDMDAYGHVNNAVFLNYLEEVRDAWAARVLGPTSDVWDFVLARVAIDYRHQLTQDDGEVTVTCRVHTVGRSSIGTREEILMRNGTLAAEASSVIVPRDPERGGSRPLTERERSVLESELERDADPPSG